MTPQKKDKGINNDIENTTRKTYRLNNTKPTKNYKQFIAKEGFIPINSLDPAINVYSL